MKNWGPLVAFMLFILFFLCFRFFFLDNIGKDKQKKVEIGCYRTEKKEIKEEKKEISVQLATISADTVVIKEGGSLCRDLGMTTDEAYAFAQRFGLKHYDSKKFFIVLVHPGDTFVRDWRPIEFTLK